jgi:FkbM family methyltransferase
MLDIKQVLCFLKDKNIFINSLAHLGANHAQGRQEYLDNGIEKILWVEAIPELANKLKFKLQNSVTDLVLEGVLSDTTGDVVQFNVASNSSMSSSIFEFKEHTKMYPSISMMHKLRLTTTTFDDLLKNTNTNFDYDVAVLDLQGAEIKALKGANILMKRVKAVVVEVSKIELYSNAPLEEEVDYFLLLNNFKKSLASYTEYGWGEALYIKDDQ